MTRNFQQVRTFLVQNFPELDGRITGGNYPLPPHAMIIQQALSAAQIFAMASVVMGDGIWSYVPFMGGRAPDWYLTAKENGTVVVIGLFLIAPTVVQSYVTTGAFEIELDGEVVFSKLKEGRMPNAHDLVGKFVDAGLTKVEAAR